MSDDAPWLVLAAAGSGRRLGATVPKALVELAGRSLVAHALDAIIGAGVRDVVVVGPPDSPYDLGAADSDGGLRVTVVSGGPTRSASVRNGLARIPREVETVAIHDAARALTPPEVIRTCLDAVGGDVVAAAPARPVGDTVKRVDGDQVVATVDRTPLRTVQTPQVFRHEVLLAALAWAGAREATDDLAVVERARAAGVVHGRIRLVPGSAYGLKITWPEDLTVAAALLAARPAAAVDARRPA